MATNTATKAAQNGAAATDAAFKAATDAATDFARTASEAFAPTMEKATGQVQEYVDATFAQAKKSSLVMIWSGATILAKGVVMLLPKRKLSWVL